VPGKEGKLHRKEFMVHPGAAVILPLLNESQVVLIRTPRPATGEILWELPAGTLEKGELPETTAARELEEETGYKTKKLTFLLRFFVSPGVSNEMIYAYVANDLTQVGQKLEDSEDITVYSKSISEVFEMIKEGKIQDAKTIITLLSYFSKK
jgi:ADP-ribose pyrophosphatase